MLELFTTDDFAAWFSAQDDETAEDVATALGVIERLGPDCAAPGSTESLLFYEHSSAKDFALASSLSVALEAWGPFRDYARRILSELESSRLVARLGRLEPSRADRVFRAVDRIKRLSDPRTLWTSKLRATTSSHGEAKDAREPLREAYFDALEAAGFDVVDVPSHSLALRQLCRRVPEPAYRILYGVDARGGRGLVALGEWLDRNGYGASLKRAERAWRDFLSGGERAERRYAR